MLIAFAVLLAITGLAVGHWAFEFDAQPPALRADLDVAPAPESAAVRKPKPSDTIFDIDPATVSGVDYETTRRGWSAERMDAGAVFAVTVTDALGRVAKHCRAELEPVIAGLGMGRAERGLPAEEAENLWARHGPAAAKVRLRGPAMDDSIEFRVLVTDNAHEAIVLRAGRRMFVPSVPAEVFELLAEGCPRKSDEEELR